MKAIYSVIIATIFDLVCVFAICGVANLIDPVPMDANLGAMAIVFIALFPISVRAIFEKLK